jgi:cobalt/nickel transport system permease protein
LEKGDVAGLPANARTLEDSLRAITSTLEQSLFAEQMAGRAGFMQSLDARAKLISLLLLLLAVGLSRNLAGIAAVYALALALAWASAIPLDALVGRVWLALPFFTGLIALPALFLTPGPGLFDLPLGLEITTTGLSTALFLLLRVSTSLSLTLLLVLTTPWNAVLGALGVLRVPDVFILMLGMTYRFIYLLLRVTNDLFLSRRSRIVGPVSTGERQRMLAAIAGTLLGKTLTLSSEVFLAMQSRGFRGTVVTLKPLNLRARDWVFLGASASFAAATLAVWR